ncbi:hypothetical protein [Pseudomonas fluorescens]|uniref:hypothetical protein n=1 Tax=Pseudomonas fluorescens TaxID=294 RepID=UPI001241FC4D|nr:hypothetical protein [Pseudomonas fluorescens]
MTEKSNRMTTGMMFARVNNTLDFMTKTVEFTVDQGTPSALRLEGRGYKGSQITHYFYDFSTLAVGVEMPLGQDRKFVSSRYRDCNGRLWEPISGSIKFLTLDLVTDEVVVLYDFKALPQNGSLPEIDVYGAGIFKGLVVSAEALSAPDRCQH